MTLTAPHAGAAGTAAGPRPWAGMTAPRGGRRVGRRRRWFAAHPAWPVTALLAGYPVWWALGLGDLSVVIMAVPMMLRMHAWHRQGRRVRVPPAFGLWLMFLVVVAAGIATLGLTAPGTVVSPLSNRLLAFVIRGLTYLALTVILLRGEPDRERAAAAPTGLAARPGRHLRHHRRPGRGGGAGLPVQVADGLRSAAGYAA